MSKRTTQFLNISLILVSIFCVIIFTIQTACINWMGEDAIHQMGIFYMSGITKQVTSHFGTIIELRLSQVEAIVHAVPPGRFPGKTSMQAVLSYNARSAGFEYLAFYMEDGTFQMIYGSQVTPDVPESLHQSVQGGKDNVCAGKDASGTSVVLVGVPAIYPMDNGKESIALIAGLPASYLNDTLDRSIQNDILQYSIIRDDGSYILRSDSAEEENYFERVDRLYEPCGGKEPAQYAAELRSAIASDMDYTSEIIQAGERWNVYCTRLPNSEWNLLLKISHGTLDQTINLLQKRWSYVSIGGCGLIICALMLVFVGYCRLTKLHMQALEEARETAERAKLAAERSNRAKNEFLSNMSHDIRTPMNGIMGMTSIAIGNLDDPARVRACLKKIHISSRHLLGLITDMLDMSKLESGKLTLNLAPISIREIMQNIMTIIQPQIQEKNQRFSIYIHEIYHENVCADRIRLSQILLNILGNSVKFTPEGGAIEADLYEEPSPKGSGYIRSHLHIRDNGIGMSKEFQSRIFEAFAREDSARIEKAAGAGMGMTITKYIVDAMGGTISVDSEQGKGSHFHITVDLELAAEQEKKLRLPGQRVLVVDDDQTACRLAVAALESIGLCADAAADPAQAFQMVEEHWGRPKAYQLLLLNHHVQGQDGLQIAEKLSCRFGADLPVVLLTDGELDELEESANGTIRGFISKPLFRSSLYYGLGPLLETQAPQPEKKEEEPVLDLTGRRILIAEDNELNWEIASEILLELGMEVDWAENGQICVEKYSASTPGWYDAILMDLRMPVMTGYEATMAIRALERTDAHTVPIIAVSADAFQEDIQKCLACGMNAHTAKPFDPKRVLSLLNQYLNRP